MEKTFWIGVCIAGGVWFGVCLCGWLRNEKKLKERQREADQKMFGYILPENDERLERAKEAQPLSQDELKELKRQS